MTENKKSEDVHYNSIHSERLRSGEKCRMNEPHVYGSKVNANYVLHVNMITKKKRVTLYFDGPH